MRKIKPVHQQLVKQNMHTTHSNSSIAKWTSPSSAEQQKYYSKHAPKKFVYGIIATVLQIVHAAIDFAALRFIIGAAVGRFVPEAYHFIFSIIAVAGVVALHAAFRASWEGYWYDKLDSDSRTDSSIIPALIIAALIASIGYKGASMKMQEMHQAPVIQSDSTIVASRSAELAQIQSSSEKTQKEIKEAFAAQIKSIKSKYNTQIADIKRRTRKQDQAYSQKRINDLIAQRDAELAQIEAEKAKNITNIATASMAAKTGVSTRTDSLQNAVTGINLERIARAQAEMRSIERNSWYISLGLILIVMLLTYSLVRINIKSGIMPVYEFTQLQAHGGPMASIGHAIKDVWNRRLMAFATGLHRFLSPEKIEEIDSRVVTHQSYYQTQGSGTAQAPQGSITDAQAYDLVFRKMSAAGASLTPDQFQAEMELAKRLGQDYLYQKPQHTAATGGA